MKDLPHLTDEEIKALRRRLVKQQSISLDYSTKRALLILCDYAVSTRAELAAAQAKLDAIEGLPRYTLTAIGSHPGGYASGVGDWIRATDLQRITNKEKA